MIQKYKDIPSVKKAIENHFYYINYGGDYHEMTEICHGLVKIEIISGLNLDKELIIDCAKEMGEIPEYIYIAAYSISELAQYVNIKAKHNYVCEQLINNENFFIQRMRLEPTINVQT